MNVVGEMGFEVSEVEERVWTSLTLVEQGFALFPGDT